MSIKTRFAIIALVLSVMLIAIAACIFMVTVHSNNAIEYKKLRSQSLRIANHLRQSSDDLTRMARSFANTGEPRYEEYFYEILSVREGTSPRPIKYAGIYWDYITALSTNFTPDKGDSIGLLTLLDQLGGTPEETALLKKTLSRSNELSAIETEAINAVKGLFKNEDGAYELQAAPRLDYARSLLYSKEYHLAKATIMYPIEQFYGLVDRRTASQIKESQQKQKNYRSLAFLLILMTAISLSYAIFHIRRNIINPILELSRIANRIKDGNADERATVEREDEIGILARSFNEMNDNLAGVISRLEEISYVDALTQLANRRVFDQTLDKEIRRHQRSEKPLTLMLIDVDFFKKLNDASGHQVGDSCLAEVADILANHFERAGDVVARYGGEEFAAILPDTDAHQSPNLISNVCKAIEDAKIPHPDSAISAYITASVGAISLIPDREITTESIIKGADNALYQAKASGRNCGLLFPRTS
ncbi:diguanylate cyclase [Corallincola luteus]|uniref:diguanylate cyclase n=1 Tax=Corallincola luteus TaxID=1775177 RepID=A0ABY2ALC7_9GAMM|nr:diguanylate cyclase [Corallincola luteus]TCI02258.1 diguanylate cyclase [Corallincola luteus]